MLSWYLFGEPTPPGGVRPGENAHCGAEVRGALAQWDVRLQEVWASQRDTS
jgi:hypothetical protein